MNNPNVQPPSSQYAEPSPYSSEDSKQQAWGSKFAPLWSRFQYYLREAWPWIYRAINHSIYFLISLIKGIVKIAIDQIKNFKGG